jgi:hypothetical protein
MTIVLLYPFSLDHTEESFSIAWDQSKGLRILSASNCTYDKLVGFNNRQVFCLNTGVEAKVNPFFGGLKSMFFHNPSPLPAVMIGNLINFCSVFPRLCSEPIEPKFSYTGRPLIHGYAAFHVIDKRGNNFLVDQRGSALEMNSTSIQSCLEHHIPVLSHSFTHPPFEGTSMQEFGGLVNYLKAAKNATCKITTMANLKAIYDVLENYWDHHPYNDRHALPFSYFQQDFKEKLLVPSMFIKSSVKVGGKDPDLYSEVATPADPSIDKEREDYEQWYSNNVTKFKGEPVIIPESNSVDSPTLEKAPIITKPNPHFLAPQDVINRARAIPSQVQTINERFSIIEFDDLTKRDQQEKFIQDLGKSKPYNPLSNPEIQDAIRRLPPPSISFSKIDPTYGGSNNSIPLVQLVPDPKTITAKQKIERDVIDSLVMGLINETLSYDDVENLLLHDSKKIAELNKRIWDMTIAAAKVDEMEKQEKMKIASQSLPKPPPPPMVGTPIRTFSVTIQPSKSGRKDSPPKSILTELKDETQALHPTGVVDPPNYTVDTKLQPGESLSNVSKAQYTARHIWNDSDPIPRYFPTAEQRANLPKGTMFLHESTFQDLVTFVIALHPGGINALSILKFLESKKVYVEKSKLNAFLYKRDCYLRDVATNSWYFRGLGSV